MDNSIKEKATRHSLSEWEAQKDTIERLYVLEKQPLKNVIQILFNEFGFAAR